MEHDEKPISEADFRVLLHLRSQDDPPACEEGMELLLAFAQGSPTLYELAVRVDFIDPVHPGFRTNPRWLAFTQHRSICEDCNELWRPLLLGMSRYTFPGHVIFAESPLLELKIQFLAGSCAWLFVRAKSSHALELSVCGFTPERC